MSSAVKMILGVSVLAMAAGYAACGSTVTPTPSGGVVPVTAGAGPTGAGGASAGAPAAGGGAPAAGGGAAAGAPAAVSGIPLTMAGGWVDGASNTAKIQGAVFTYGDDVSKMGMTSPLLAMPVDPTVMNACMAGTAAKVDTMSVPCMTKMFTAPATDCYGQFWGAAIGLNLNQMIDATTMMGGAPMPYDASALKGFAFDISGTTVPSGAAFRFKADDGTKEFCTQANKKLVVGTNSVLFTELITECWKPTTTSTTADTSQSKLLKISWQVVTNDKGTVPFDFCVSNVVAIPK